MIISDSTAIIALINIDKFDILERFTSPIVITDEVYAEVSVMKHAKKFLDTKISQEKVLVQNTKDRDLIGELGILLDFGEASSIALAIEISVPLVIDEKKGRKIAKENNVKVIGLVGILKYLYTNSIHSKDETISIINELKHVGFYIDDRLSGLIIS